MQPNSEEKYLYRIKELEKEIKKLQDFISNLPMGYQSLDKDGNFISVNETWLNLLGYSREEIIGHWFGNFLAPQDIEKFKKIFSEFKDNNTAGNHEFELIPKSGKKIPIRFECKVSYKDGHFKQTHCIFQSLSEIKRKEKEKEEAENKLQYKTSLLETTFNVIPDYIGIIDTNFNSLMFNQALYDYLGTDKKNAVGKKCYEVLHTNELCDNCPAAKCKITKKPEKTEFFHPGLNLWVEMRAFPVFDKKGKIYQIVEYIRNISERKSYEEQKDFLLKEMRKKNKLKNEFLANISHELRTPLNGIFGFLTLLSDTENSEIQTEYIRFIEESSIALLKLVDDILTLVQTETGKGYSVRTEFEIKRLIKNLGISLKNKSDKNGLSFFLDLDPDIPEVLIGDKSKLFNILDNVLDNAVKFTEKGSIHFRIKILDRKKKSAKISFLIKDTGIGIPDDYKADVFEIFTQVDGSYTRKAQGLGLGLAIAKQLTQFLNGHIYLDSTENEGTEVEIILPFLIPNPNEKITQKDVEDLEIKKKKYKILLAEDNNVNTQLVKKILESYNFDLTAVHNGLDALEVLKREDFHLILMDIKMPILDGIETTRKIREGECGDSVKDVPIIGMTAFNIQGLIKEMYKSGMNNHIIKPFDKGRLLKVIIKYFKG